MATWWCFSCDKYFDTDEQDHADYEKDMCQDCVDLNKEKKETINGAGLVIEQQMIVIDKLKEELLEVKDQVDREHEVVIAAQDLVYLEMSNGVPIAKDSRKKAMKSLIMEVEAYEEWEEGL